MKPTFTAIALLAACASGAAHASAYPDRPIKLIVPYAAGGTTDIIARIVGTRLGPVLGQPVVVENRPGAGGAVGSAYAARQPADGYTLVMEVESSHAVNPNVYLKTAYDPVKDFAPVSNLADVPNVLVVNPAFPATDLQSFIKLLKANPGKYSFGSSGNGGLSHMNGELFMNATGTRMLHVPYKGLGPALNDAVAGQIQVVFDNIPSSSGLIQGGRLKPLAVAAQQRLKVLPNVPTYAEAGLPAMNNPSWFGLGAPAGTPSAILDKLNDAVRQVLAEPEVIAAIEKQGAIPAPSSRKAFGDLIRAQNAHWKQVVEDIHFTRLQ
ncbi:Tripartite-type tricarboxylate transporter, extracytoplasmic receptor component TctC [Cupriavidus necator]|uniref:Probable extra-cytoplasmic solute receptor n=1 Tax=Cupriavidus necator (strain ATCC 17699 / DSM 428 / KCTC 22496 / NCIMB 10442 / H16 / Stanier 337) TaxID=381666 RepID=Q0JY59_CUPNH|nr:MULTISPECIES: tripartite tricarboxylate transporter substrate binding protein [Cupriavidus]EON19666.1 extra-cytoplasmic solute receptor [Cupriavidus sp. GA3-3]KUE87901.1 ABC transporter substrate-binding protein [Cupriavidus necator]QCC05076.1 tripartite tricarboxylate transporter substrate binding protein [Cupriavidus necator H16]QQB79764.1 tripartite tricarboxylate transporter substrate binding protein [Cupriavidus necator]WKA44009.1 tripartite tricarboxylate transporter substrate binding